VGAIGDDLRMDYTAIGDTTNLAMRMESMTMPGDIQISENTYRLIKAYFDCEDLGSVPVKGKEEPQRLYKLLKPSEVQTRIEASISKGLVRFVGRKNSMTSIQNAWDKASKGSGQVLGVVGEAGVGKSRLLLEFRSAIGNADFNYLEGHCLHYGGSMAYLPFLDIMKAYFRIEEGQQEYFIDQNIKKNLTALNSELLLDSRPAFQDLLSLKIEEESWLTLEPKIKRDRTFEALRNLFIRLSEEKPLIIAVEDLHWMDKTSEEFISYFIDSMANSPILLILLYRPEYTHQWGSKSYYSKIGLDQLTRESSAYLVSAILEGSEVATELRDLILNRSVGNPLFMEEFTHTLLENGSIERKNNQFVLSRKIDDIQVPETIQGIIAARMDRLEENLKRTMQVASVIGRDFAFRILQTITGMREELNSHLLNLQGLELIYEKSLFPELEYISHPGGRL
jgi:predicted ATPase